MSASKSLAGLVITRAATASLATFPYKVKAQLIKRAKALILNPHPVGSKKLKGKTTDDGEPMYRQRSGDYRIVYAVRENLGEVIVLAIDNRKDAYK